jgi:hypothetical protein
MLAAGGALARYFGCKKSPAEARLEFVTMRAGGYVPAEAYFETNSHAPSSRYPTL